MATIKRLCRRILRPLESGALKFDDARVFQSTPEEYVASIAAHCPALQKIRGALYSGRYIAVFPGVLSSRIYLKQQNDFCQRQLEHYAEPLSALMWGLGAEHAAGALARAWRLLLKNHPHDSICGVSIDDVHTDMEARFAQVGEIAARVTDAALATLAANVDTGGSADALGAWVVFNPLLRARDALIEILADLSEHPVFCDGAGQVLPHQRGTRGEWLVAMKLPACGYASVIASPFGAKQSPTDFLLRRARRSDHDGGLVSPRHRKRVYPRRRQRRRHARRNRQARRDHLSRARVF